MEATMDVSGFLSKQTDLIVTVTDAKTQGSGIKEFTDFAVHTKTTLATFEGTAFEVRRRYSDFVWLRGRISVSCPHCVVPPLPEKKAIGGKQEAFVEERRRALERFLVIVSDHEEMREAGAVKSFLCAENLEAAKKEDAAAGVFSGIGDAIANLRLKGDNAEFEALKSKAASLKGGWAELARCCERLYANHTEQAAILGEMEPLLAAVAESEPNEGGMLLAVGSAAKKAGELQAGAAVSDAALLAGNFKQYAASMDAVVETLRRRDMAEKSQNDADDAHGKLVAEKDALEQADGVRSFSTMFKKKDPAEAKAEKMNELSEKIEAAAQELETKTAQMHKMNREVKQEIEQWEGSKRNHLSEILRSWVGARADTAKAAQTLWREVLPEIEEALKAGPVAAPRPKAAAADDASSAGGAGDGKGEGEVEDADEDDE